MKKILQGKKVLVTAGPTWVPLDKVRVITNIFSGRTGYEIAHSALKMGANVTFIIGPGKLYFLKSKPNFNVVHFKYFDDLYNLVKKEVAKKKYDIVIHSAAVADYRPVEIKSKKIKSNKNILHLVLKPTKKIVDIIKKYDPNTILVKFKLEVNVPEKKLLRIAKKSMKISKADFIIANDLNTLHRKHVAFIIDNSGNVKKVFGRKKLANELLRRLYLYNKKY